ncbi:MAG: dTMP kinase [Candidatus Woesebacteria bacterium]|nr:dTMP kinase [Candidatus Woesebacteria bacterium]
MRKYPGYFITLEGSEGSSKTTQIPRLVESLRQEGLTVYPTREPGGTSIGEQIREVIQSLKNTEMHPRTETLLYQAARAQIVEQVICPMLAEGRIVISDRFFDSTIAYQGYGRQQDREQIRALINYATGGLIPDLTVFMDVDIEVGLKRRRGGAEWNRMDAFEAEFYQRVKQGYLELISLDPARWVVVDANRSIDEVFSDLKREVDNRLISNGFIEGNGFGPEREK